MTLYELIQKISAILTPDTGYFYAYCMHHCDDDGGFLRSRYCYRDKPLKDCTLREPKHKAVVCFEQMYQKDTDKFYLCQKNGKEFVTALFGLQLFYTSDEMIEEEMEVSCNLGYTISYVFDLDSGTYTIEEREPIY